MSLFFRIDKARGQLQKAKTAGITDNRFEAYVYKPKKKGVTVPFGLAINTSSLLGEIVKLLHRMIRCRTQCKD